MAEAMRQNVAQFLYGIERYVVFQLFTSVSNIKCNSKMGKQLTSCSRYNPENLATLEKYVQVQSQENAYDLEANLAVLKLYQFNQQYNSDITTQILLKALTNLPHTDFALCKCLLNEQMVLLSKCYVYGRPVRELFLGYVGCTSNITYDSVQ